MRILRIRLQNLNSLRGEHEVDLEAEPLGSAGIFSITGPTGAGKSTLLDAITLALYGRAARYGESANPEDMMSRHTGECQAEVDFQVEDGRFRAVWQLRRARSKADGNLQPARRYLYDETGAVLADKIKDVDKAVLDLCGLDYHRFTRSVLLAQGEFAKFLKASPDDRAALLESLTGTAIYSELGQLVHEELSRRQQELDHAEATLSQMTLLSEAERKARQDELHLKKDQTELDQRRRNGMEDRRQKGLRLRDSLREEAEVLAAQQALAKRREESQEGLAALERHRQALPFLPDLREWEQATARIETRRKAARVRADEAAQGEAAYLRGLFQADTLRMRQAEELLKVQEQAAETLRASEQHLKECQAWLEEHVRDADLAQALPGIRDGLTRVTEARREEARMCAMVPTLPADYHGEAGLPRAQGRLKDLFKQGDEAARSLTVEKLGERQGALESLEVKLRERAKLDQKLQARSESIALLTKRIEEADTTRKDREKSFKHAQELLTEKRNHLETARWAASLEEHQANLTAGEPCPLCGSEHHPYAEGLRPQLRLKELEAKVTEAEHSLEAARKLLDAVSVELAQIRTEAETIRKEHTTIDQERAALLDEIHDTAQGLQLAEPDSETLGQARETCAAQLQAAKAELDMLRNLERIVQRLERQAVRQQAEAALTNLLTPFQLALPESQREDGFWQGISARASGYVSKQEDLRKAETRRTEAEAGVKAAAVERTLLDEKARPLRDLIEKAGPRPEPLPAPPWPDLDAALAAVQELRQEKETASVQLTLARKEVEEAEKWVGELQECLEQKLRTSPFASLEMLRQTCLSEDRQKELANLEQTLTAEGQRLEGKLDQSRKGIVHLRENEAPEAEALQTLEAELRELDQALQSQRERITILSGELQRDQEAHDLHACKTAALEEERQKLRTWEMLHGLIGSSKGQKFRLFAQGISLDLLVRHANRHLRRLTERYLLKRCVGKDLELEIEDLYQACVARPMASLSGGESFLVSLALALGLSDLAGRNARIDSLFIDEGFGSLDSDSLEIAISALESLRQRSKTVGIISHVDVLKERIATQIAVEKRPDGTSILLLRP